MAYFIFTFGRVGSRTLRAVVAVSSALSAARHRALAFLFPLVRDVRQQTVYGRGCSRRSALAVRLQGGRAQPREQGRRGPLHAEVRVTVVEYCRWSVLSCRFSGGGGGCDRSLNV